MSIGYSGKYYYFLIVWFDLNNLLPIKVFLFLDLFGSKFNEHVDSRCNHVDGWK